MTTAHIEFSVIMFNYLNLKHFTFFIFPSSKYKKKYLKNILIKLLKFFIIILQKFFVLQNIWTEWIWLTYYSLKN